MNALIDNFHLLAAAPNGVPKLRELILSLAVRGKLVSQDSHDEPASELLKKIAAEKARLIKEGKIKKDKPLPEISEDEKPYALQRGWEWVRFGEIAQHNSGKTLDSGRNKGISRPYITTSNLYWGRFELSSVRQMLIRDDELEKCTATKHDLLICEGGEAGRAAVWSFDYDISFQNHIHRARFYSGIDPYYAYRFLEKLNATGEICQYRKGVGISNMSSKALASIVLSLPPLAEQRRIVAKVDELMRLCDQLEAQQTMQGDAHERLVASLLDSLTQAADAQSFAENWARLAEHFDLLFDTPESIAKLKQALLQLAVQGKLVPQDQNDEPASELLKKTAAEKARLIEQGKLKKDKPLPEIAEDEKPYALPQGWVWSTLSNVALINPRNDVADEMEASFVPMAMIGTSFNGAHDQEKKPWKEIKKGFTHFAEGDIAVAKITPCFENSKACVFSGLENGVGAGTTELHVIRPVGKALNPKYVLAYLKAPEFLLVGEGKMTGTAGQKRLPKEFVELNPFPLPPLAEQQRIVAKVDELMQVCDALADRLTHSRELASRLAETLAQPA